MHPQLWQRVGELFEQALELAPERRRELLDALCAGDAALQSEVELLLDADATAQLADGVLNAPLPRAITLRPIGAFGLE